MSLAHRDMVVGQDMTLGIHQDAAADALHLLFEFVRHAGSVKKK